MVCCTHNFIEFRIYELFLKLVSSPRHADRRSKSLFQQPNSGRLLESVAGFLHATRGCHRGKAARHTMIADIKAALQAEIKSLPTCAVFTIIEVAPTGNGWRIKVQGKPSHGAATETPLTDDFVNAGACWYSPTSGSATVSRVDLNTSHVSLVNVKNTPPRLGQDILLFPRDYITPVLSRWEDDNIAQNAIACARLCL